MKIGIDIGGSHIGLGIVNDSGEIISKVEKNIQKVENMENELVKNIVQNIEVLLINENLNISQIELIGIAVPGVIKQNKIYKCNNLGLNGFNLVEKLEKRRRWG